MPYLSPLLPSSPPIPLSTPPLHPSPRSLLFLQAKVDDEIIDYRALAAIPRVKAIYDIERPDMISYEAVQPSSSTLQPRGDRQDRLSPIEVKALQAHSLLHWVWNKTN